MKKHVYNLLLELLLTLLLSINLNAQEYTYIPLVKPGVQIWTDDYWECAANYHFRRFALTDEDTLIENETYKKLYFFTDNVFNSSTAECIGGLRENEQKQVFFKGGNISGILHSGLIYNFSLSVGDTFSHYFYFDFPQIFEIKSIDTIDYAGAMRKRFNIGLYGDTILPYYSVGKLIEGIGNTQGLMYDIYYNLTLCGYGGMNRCYEHNGVLLYHNYSQGIEDCFTPLAGLNDIKTNDNDVLIYPNPTSKELTIESNDIINSIEIYNFLGQKVYQTKVNNKNKSINLNIFTKGLYIIGINREKGYIKKKIVKD
jgi:hypothetical protein